MEVYNNVLLVSPSEIKASGELNLNVDDSVISAAIQTAQNVYLQDVIGTDFLNVLTDKVYEHIAYDRDIEEEYVVLLEKYIYPVLLYKTVSEVMLRISLKIRNIGVSQNNDTNINGVSLSDIKYLRDNYETYYDHSVDRLVEYLGNNRETFGLEGCSCLNVKKYGNLGLWLGR